MTVAKTLAVALAGVSGRLVEIEADVGPGLPGLTFTGLADVSVVESRDRIRAAVMNSAIEWPNKRITLALFPADVPKIGSRFDLALAIAVLAATGVVAPATIADSVWIAELGLDGSLRPVRGVLPAVLAARRAGVRRVVVARANCAEAALAYRPGGSHPSAPEADASANASFDVHVADDLSQVVGWLTGRSAPPERATAHETEAESSATPDLADVAGQQLAKRALEVAAAGRHHVFLQGAPGAGKTMLAERLPGLLPRLNDDAALDVTAVHSVAGRLDSQSRLVRRPPWQAPHHSTTVAALVGGGSGLARPGAISLAHHGVLFLDEAPEFTPRAIDALRQPLESGEVVLHRSQGAVTYPARFQLVLAANPCPCGRRERDCACAPNTRRRYEQRLSGPLLDRVDVRMYVDPVPRGELFEERANESSADVARRVAKARATAAQRWADSGWSVNADAPGAFLRQDRFRLSPRVVAPAELGMERGQLSARGYDRVLRMAWSIADLAGHVTPTAGDLAEALFFRTGRSGSVAA
ncbi:MAG: YifB family Mg chelatase-like AAA ATPase [Actinobacteria bacterium]|nr:YifB family Mg chelatase-like AAA ATPase [Actinomycetota bacterium]